MKIKENFALKNIANDFFLVPLNYEKKVKGMVYLNEVATFITKLIINEECSEKQIVDMILEKYDIDIETAKNDLSELIKKFKDLEIIDNE